MESWRRSAAAMYVVLCERTRIVAHRNINRTFEINIDKNDKFHMSNNEEIKRPIK